MRVRKYKIIDPNLEIENNWIYEGDLQGCKDFLEVMRNDLVTFEKAFNYIIK